jgi:hypothetical protein
MIFEAKLDEMKIKVGELEALQTVEKVVELHASLA